MDSWRALIIALLLASIGWHLIGACGSSSEEPIPVTTTTTTPKPFNETEEVLKLYRDEQKLDEFVYRGCVFPNGETWCKNNGRCSLWSSSLHCSCGIKYAGDQCEDEYIEEPFDSSEETD